MKMKQFETRLPQPQEGQLRPGAIVRAWVHNADPSGSPGAGEDFVIVRFAASSSGYAGKLILVRTFSELAEGDEVMVAFANSPVGTFNSAPVQIVALNAGGGGESNIPDPTEAGQIIISHSGNEWIARRPVLSG